VITRFGNPVRVVTEPGLAWKLPAPFESTILIDLRLRTTSTGLQDVGTRDGLRVLVQSYVAWQVPDDPQRVRQFLRSVRNQPDEAARQLRSFVNAALHITASNFDLADLVNIDSTKVRLDVFERELREQVAPRMLAVYGIEIRQVGVERMTLPDETLAATVSRMRAERETAAAQVTADGLRQAAAIRADADRDAREVVAQAHEQAAHTEADAQQAAARIYAKAYQADPGLYSTLRSLDSLSQILGRNSSLILRTDAAPFRVLVDGPSGAGAPPAGKPKP
jgi:modulator of FtsH protease HflC